MLTKDVFVLNTSESRQQFRHPTLGKLHVLACSPGDYVSVEKSMIFWQPGMAIKIPTAVWNIGSGPSLCRQPWAKRITEEEFNMLQIANKAPVVCPQCGYTINDSEAVAPALEELSMKELRDVAGKYGLTVKVGMSKADVIKMLEEATTEEIKT